MATRHKHKKTSLKDWPTVYQEIKGMPELDEHEKILFARFAAATPDERWRMNVRYLRSLDCWGRSALKKFASLKFHRCKIPVMPLESVQNSKAAPTRAEDSVHIHYTTRVLRLRRKTK